MSGAITASAIISLTIGETVTMTAAVFAATGYFFKRGQVKQDEHGRKLNTMSESLAVLTAQAQPNEERLASVERRTVTLSENQSVLAALFERHERWHEEHPYVFPTRRNTDGVDKH
jgi:hypothetical protein